MDLVAAEKSNPVWPFEECVGKMVKSSIAATVIDLWSPSTITLFEAL